MQAAPSAAARGLRSFLTIKLVVIGTLAALAALIAGKFAWEARSSWNAYSQAVDQQAFDQGINRLITGLFEVLMERLATNNALQAANPADQATFSEIEKRRKLVRENFDPGLEALRGRDFPTSRR